MVTGGFVRLILSVSLGIAAFAASASKSRAQTAPSKPAAPERSATESKDTKEGSASAAKPPAVANGGGEHWMVTQARLTFEFRKKFESLTPAERTDLEEAQRFYVEQGRLSEAGKYAEAEKLARRSLEIRKRILGPRHEQVASSLNALGSLLHSTGSFAESERLLVEAVAIHKAVSGAKHPNHGVALNNLGLLYDDMSAHLRAGPLFIESLNIRKEAFGPKSPEYARGLANLAGHYHKIGAHSRALPLYVEALEIRKATLGPKHLVTARSLQGLAGAYEESGDYARAEEKFVESLAIFKETVGVKSRDYAGALTGLAVVYKTTGRYPQAEAAYKEVIELRKEVLGAMHPHYATSLNNLARLYIAMGRDKLAEPLITDSLRISKAAYGEKHPKYALSLASSAELYHERADYDRAEQLYLESLAITKEALGTKHPDYGKTLIGLAYLYDGKANYARAESLYLEALELQKNVVGRRHPLYAQCLSALAGVHQSMGDYVRAEPELLEALDIHRESLGTKHPAYAGGLSALALFRSELGDFARAEPLLVEAAEISKETLGENHPDYASRLSKLATLYLHKGDIERAASMYAQAHRIVERALGEKHPTYAASVTRLALVLSLVGDYARAITLYSESLKITKASRGDRHPNYATCLNSIGLAHLGLGDHEKAEPFFKEAHSIMKETFGERHPDLASSLHNLGSMYLLRGDHAGAEPRIREALKLSFAALEATSTIQSERQQLAMSGELRIRLDHYVSLGVNSGRYARNVFEEVLNWQGLTLVRQRAIRSTASDPAIAESFQRLQEAASRLASLSRAVPGKDADVAAWRKRLTDLTFEKERIESELSAKSAAFRQIATDLKLEALLAALPRDAMLVDFLEFNRFFPQQKRDAGPTWESQLVAFVVRPAAKPDEQVTLVALGASEPIAQAIDTWRTTLGDGAEAEKAAGELRRLVWEPVEKHLTGATTVLVSTDGALGRLPLGALPGKTPGTFLLEDYRLAMIPVPRLLPDLVAPRADERKLAHELLLLGDVDYDAAPDATAPSQPSGALVASDSSSRAPQAGGTTFGRLPGTKEEVAALERLFSATANGKSVVSLTSTAATEARFRALAPQCRSLHLATHGFFAPESVRSAADAASGGRPGFGEQEQAVVGYSPNLLSGLALAGANRPPSATGDDGILTAEEIATLPLDGARLVTLSACETGLGRTAGGEGLLGLQRAFQVSGARTTIASYWKVDDQTTRVLMERFYKNLAAATPEKPVGMLDALREAQLWVLRNPTEVIAATSRGLGASKSLPTTGRPNSVPSTTTTRSPIRLWAAFALSGDWR